MFSTRQLFGRLYGVLARFEFRLVTSLAVLSFALGVVGSRHLYPPGTAGSDWNYQDVVYSSFMLFILEAGADAGSAAGFHRM